MAMETIHPQTQIGLVSLTVADFGRSLPYYQGSIGLKLLRQDGNVVQMGVGKRPLLELVEQPEAMLPRGTTGLYHFALLVPSRLELAKTFKNLVDSKTDLGGFSDHSVSEALYLSDPDGNGIEIYRDRPPEEWPRQNGRLQMNTQPLDLQSLMGELNGRSPQWQGLHPDTKMGHIHLHIRDLDEAEDFYCNKLGFERIMRYGAAAGFVSAGGYHHHIGLNSWAGQGAAAPPANAAGLRHFQILLPTQTALDTVKHRLQANNLSTESHHDGLFLHDPSQNRILLKVK
ncbi:Glyoxalase family protein [hydrothermal vent metagenome]|uniref:Glyoxalase family protein n=1 Tax=hydrothermal vent metagenome TaxID=652676 RepID=A0A3B0VHU1_9ZZZZ